MPTINATPKSSTANSYMTRARCLEILGDRMNSSAYIDATQTLQEQALIVGTWLLDAGMQWFGDRRTTDQALGFPRTGAVNVDGWPLDYDTIPLLLERALGELVVFLLTSDRFAEPGVLGQGFSQASLGSISVTVDPSQVLPYLPAHVIGMLAPLGVSNDAMARGGARVVKLARA